MNVKGVLVFGVLVSVACAFSITISGPNNYFTEFDSTLQVPNTIPKKQGTIFLWPGLEPLQNSKNFEPIGQGVIQPVLTWGPSCAPHQKDPAYTSWWISGQYVNTLGNDPNYEGCYGGDVMEVKPNEKLRIQMSYRSPNWVQKITRPNGQSVSYSINMGGQGQNWAMLVVELYSTSIDFTVQYYDITLKTIAAASPCSSGRVPLQKHESCSGIQQKDSHTCYISSCKFTGTENPGPYMVGGEWQGEGFPKPGLFQNRSLF